jgi:hypothetical protein
MKIKADELTVGDLFNRGEIVFYVPVYQRRYDWTQDQWGDLWQDVTELAGNGSHFIGSVVVISHGAEVADFNKMELVDGQQRLTTISILLCALRDAYRSRGDEKQAQRIDDIYLYSQTLRARRRKITLGKLDDDSYARLLDGKPDPKHNTTAAYEFFKARIELEPDPDKIAKCFTGGIRLVCISTETAEDAFRLFETLNDRGLELSAVDLIKNYILSTAAKKSQSQLDYMAKAWEQIIADLGGVDKIRFFRQFLLANFPGKVSNSALFEQYKKRVGQDDNLNQFVSDLCEAAECYRRIHECSFDDSRLNLKLEDLVNLKATTSFTLLLKLFAVGWEPSMILEIIRPIEAFSLRRGICGWSTNEMDNIYNQIANLPSNELTADRVRMILRGNMPHDGQFCEDFTNGVFRQDSQTKYILEQFEYDAVGTGEKKIADRQAVHIEHIMPQTITTKKSKRSQGGDWISYLGADADKHGEYFQRIGNLTLLASELNVPASNNPFAAKKAFYEKSEMRITQELCQLKDWRIAQIEDRSLQLAERAVKIWSI